jgi:hypothetical protein
MEKSKHLSISSMAQSFDDVLCKSSGGIQNLAPWAVRWLSNLNPNPMANQPTGYGK